MANTRQLTTRKALVGLAAATLPLMLAAAANATTPYTITGLGTLAGGISSNAAGISDSGQVAGISHSSSSLNPFIWTSSAGMQEVWQYDGVAAAVNNSGEVVGRAGGLAPYYNNDPFLWNSTDGIQNLDSQGGGAYGINNSGEVVGNCLTDGELLQAFLWTSTGGVKGLGTLAPGTGTDSTAYSINDSGQVVGVSQTADMTNHAFLWTAASGMEDLGTLVAGASSGAYAVNDSGTVVGWSDASSGAYHAMLWTSSNGMMDLGSLSLSVDNSRALGVNDAGHVVGWSNTNVGINHAFLWTSGGGMIDLNTMIPNGSGWTLTGATGINTFGEIVGTGYSPKGTPEAYLLTPTSATGNLTPIFDAQATSSAAGEPFTIGTAGTNGIYATHYALSGDTQEQRGVTEFNLGGVPEGATITKLVLKLDIADITGGTGNWPSIGIYGYAGDGSMAGADVTELVHLLGTATVNQLGELDITLDTSYAQSLLNGGNDYLGLLEVSNINNLQTGFASEEMSWASSAWSSPTLMVSYATPEPASLALLAIGTLAMGIRRRRKAGGGHGVLS